ncbi:MAG: hypothetical protein QM496_06640 [Verrucomicrobiota bacterium]
MNTNFSMRDRMRGVIVLMCWGLLSSVWYSPDVSATTRVAINGQGRLQVDLDESGKLWLEEVVISYEQLTVISRISMRLNPKMRLHLRASKRTRTADIKKVVKAAAEGGLVNVIFGISQQFDK